MEGHHVGPDPRVKDGQGCSLLGVKIIGGRPQLGGAPADVLAPDGDKHLTVDVKPQPQLVQDRIWPAPDAAELVGQAGVCGRTRCPYRNRPRARCRRCCCRFHFAGWCRTACEPDRRPAPGDLGGRLNTARESPGRSGPIHLGSGSVDRRFARAKTGCRRFPRSSGTSSNRAPIRACEVGSDVGSKADSSVPKMSSSRLDVPEPGVSVLGGPGLGAPTPAGSGTGCAEDIGFARSLCVGLGLDLGLVLVRGAALGVTDDRGRHGDPQAEPSTDALKNSPENTRQHTRQNTTPG